MKSHGREYDWVCGGGAHDWKQEGKRQVPEWVEVRNSALSKSLKQIEETKLVWGTIWQPPLEMSMSMEPPPQVIFFMTDGATGGDVMGMVKDLAATANELDIKINTVAMMEPRAEEAMKDLAKRTGGQFSIVNKDGKVETEKK